MRDPPAPLVVEANVFLSGVGAGSDLSGHPLIKLAAASREITCDPPSIYGGVAVKGEWDGVMSALKEYHAAALGEGGSGEEEIHMTLNLSVAVGSPALLQCVPRNLADTDEAAPKKTVVLPPAARKRLLAEQAEAAEAAVATEAAAAAEAAMTAEEEEDIEVSSLSEAENEIEVGMFGKGGASDAEDEFHRLLEGLGGLRSGAKRPPGMPARRPRGDPMPNPRGMGGKSGSNSDGPNVSTHGR